MKLAVSAFEFQNEPITSVAKMLGDLGVGFVELWPGNVAGETEGDVKIALADNRIAISCVSATSQHRMNAEAVQDAQKAIFLAMDIASTYGANFVTTYLGANPNRDFLTTLKLYVQNVRECIVEAEARGITLLLENMFDHKDEDIRGEKPTRYAEGTRALVDMMGSDHFGITFDPVNFYICGVEPYPYAYEFLQPFIKNVHVKDTKKYNEFLYGSRDGKPIWRDSVSGEFISVPAGKGAINWFGIMQGLRRDGFSGYLTVDILTSAKIADEDYRETVEHMRDLIGLC